MAGRELGRAAAGVAADLDLPSATLAVQAAQRIQDAILDGDLGPDHRLTIPGLAEKLGIGMTPLREGLSRLAARGFVTSVGNRGFRVAAMSRSDLDDITGARYEVEAAALRLSMSRRDDAWESALVAAMHRLKRVIGRADGPISQSSTDYEDAHRDFHRALIDGAGLPRLTRIQGELYVQAYRYRRIMVAKGIDPDRAIEEHERLASLALGSDPEAACTALRRHLDMTFEAVYGAPRAAR